MLQLEAERIRLELEHRFLTKGECMTEFEKMLQLLDAAWLLRGEIVPCLVGPPGIGKTAAVEQHARNHGCGKVVKIVASRCIPSETVGMTMPDHKNRSMAIYNSMQLSSLEDGDILFLDELLEADQFVLSTLLTVIESREMADGTPLPDIQIVAATNDTIPSEQLKCNIRQRFMFERFAIDQVQTHDYILERTGLDISREILSKVTCVGGDYNVLTPRSLTKLCMWMNAARDDRQAMMVANVINDIWKTTIGNDLFVARSRRDRKAKTPEQQVRSEILQILKEHDVGDVMHGDDNDFKDCTISELLELMQGLPDWREIERRLADTEIEEEEEMETDISF